MAAADAAAALAVSPQLRCGTELTSANATQELEAPVSPPENAQTAQSLSAKKWWHVPDDQIEILVRSMGGPRSPAPTRGALRGPVAHLGVSKRSVQFFGSGAHAEDEDPDSQRARISLRASGAAASEDACSAREDLQARRDWRVSDEQLKEFVEATAAKLATEEAQGSQHRFAAEEALSRASGTGFPATAGRTGRSGFASMGRLVMGSASCVASNRNERASCRQRSSKCGLVSSERPAWNSSSTPNLFAHVGVGLDGKGNKTIKPDVVPFAESSIYLADVRNPSLERVRVAVCGHAAYMSR
eukprot:TRINITY_DN28070_c0_g1_i1.p1 TRINITY_DN28070_c0_g1~~TRINITY_DN28070_c0_g1_i1.p1  ORF type:complete len:315 (-),score=55.61 TRINITY_DN28070_c0_g1_i1:221-1123(-)